VSVILFIPFNRTNTLTNITRTTARHRFGTGSISFLIWQNAKKQSHTRRRTMVKQEPFVKKRPIHQYAMRLRGEVVKSILPGQPLTILDWVILVYDQWSMYSSHLTSWWSRYGLLAMLSVWKPTPTWPNHCEKRQAGILCHAISLPGSSPGWPLWKVSSNSSSSRYGRQAFKLAHWNPLCFQFTSSRIPFTTADSLEPSEILGDRWG